MGLSHRKSIYLSYSRSRSSIRRFLLIFSFLLFVIVFLSEVNSFISSTKTIAGHNLEPTPWHLFEPRTFQEESKYSTASKIIQCHYLTCGGGGDTSTTSNATPHHHKSPDSCPKFFSHIFKDLAPWGKTKISKAHLREAQKNAAFRVIIIDGKLSVDFYYACVQSRAMFTIWGFVQLLKRYPGKVPDVDMMFDCMDKPTIVREENSLVPLPLFRYCTTPKHYDIPFPDWSFWGWPETNIKPWDQEFESIKEGASSVGWRERFPFAYWKGNPDVSSEIRTKLLECNGTDLYGAQILRQNWQEEAKKGFKDSQLSKQCKHRYKIYAEGYAWSVSLKYILSCGSVPLIITPNYTDFFSRGLVENRNYFHIIPDEGMCRRIKSVVDWGNSHISAATTVGGEAQNLMASLDMDHVYDYMYHLINEYSKLLDFTPQRPSSAVDVCAESILCFADKKQKSFLTASVTQPSPSPPCTLPPQV
ncbi:hypothetical protein Leryth_016486 [Lithospermum erythrorhizon]|nr:hypothetical protein Leryth_016486 [Lithospermum erythrorhizon]